MNPKKIEMNSIIKLRYELERCDEIITDIPDNDRTPSWDGAIYLYSSSAIEKKNMIGMIHVQVKGKVVTKDKLKKHEISYSAEVDDLKNFRGVGGTIFFVVYMENYDNYKIYYNGLLPLDLENILSTVKIGQKTKNIKLNEFPINDLNIVKYLLSDFICNSRKQQSTAQKSCFVDDLKMKKYDELVFSTPDLADYAFKVPIYIYGRKNDINIDIPMAKVHLESVGINNVNMQVELDGTFYFNNISIKETNDTTIINFGAGFSLKLCKNGMEKAFDFDYSGTGKLSERIQDLRFFINLSKAKVIKIGNIFKGENITMTGYNLIEIEKELNFYLSIQKLMTELKINEDFDLDLIKEEEFKDIAIFREAIINKLPVVLNGNHESFLWFKHRIANIVIAVWAELRDDGKYTLSNVFDKHIEKFILKNDKMEEIPACFYVMLKKIDFIEVSNISYDNILTELLAVPYSKEYGASVNVLLLEMLSAFDEKANKDLELLENIIEIAQWLTQQEDDNCLFTLNYLQSILRKEKFNQSEYELVQKIKEDEIKHSNNATVLSGVSILLENKSDFVYYFNKLKQKEKEDFVKFPIYSLGKKLGVVRI